MLMSREPWKHKAACISANTTIFFSKRGGSRGPALEYCHHCDVRDSCLAEALVQPDLLGIWGGTTRRERRNIRHQEKLSPSMSFADVLAVIRSLD